jgi:hypothetical protein
MRRLAFISQSVFNEGIGGLFTVSPSAALVDWIQADEVNGFGVLTDPDCRDEVFNDESVCG